MTELPRRVEVSAEELSEDQLAELPECDINDCAEPAPFTITAEPGEVHRCRACLWADLESGWWRYV